MYCMYNTYSVTHICNGGESAVYFSIQSVHELVSFVFFSFFFPFWKLKLALLIRTNKTGVGLHAHGM